MSLVRFRSLRLRRRLWIYIQPLLLYLLYSTIGHRRQLLLPHVMSYRDKCRTPTSIFWQSDEGYCASACDSTGHSCRSTTRSHTRPLSSTICRAHCSGSPITTWAIYATAIWTPSPRRPGTASLGVCLHGALSTHFGGAMRERHPPPDAVRRTSASRDLLLFIGKKSK